MEKVRNEVVLQKAIFAEKKTLLDVPDELQMLSQHQPKKRLNVEAQVLQRNVVSESLSLCPTEISL